MRGYIAVVLGVAMLSAAGCRADFAASLPRFHQDDFAADVLDWVMSKKTHTPQAMGGGPASSVDIEMGVSDAAPKATDAEPNRAGLPTHEAVDNINRPVK